MTQVLIVCGAGASSQFIVHRIQQHTADGTSLLLGATALDLLPEEAPDLVYLGPHLHGSIAEVRRRYPDARIALMTPEEYADHSGVLPRQRLLHELQRTASQSLDS